MYIYIYIYIYICRRQLRKSGISGNALAIEEFPELPRHLQKHQAFPEMPGQLRKFLIFNQFFKVVPNSGKQQMSKF
jgi:hypothetical protein